MDGVKYQSMDNCIVSINSILNGDRILTAKVTLPLYTFAEPRGQFYRQNWTPRFSNKWNWIPESTVRLIIAKLLQ